MLPDRFSRLKNRKPGILESEKAFKSAVLLPLVEKNGKIGLLFEVRSKNLRRQPGEICFPGGQIEASDRDVQQTAIRETCEELGLSCENIEIIAPLDLLVTPMNTIIYPFLCWILKPEQIKPNPKEVAEIFWVPLDFLYSYEPQVHTFKMKLLISDDFPFHLIPNGENYNWRSGIHPEYFYIFENYIIWGMTARILNHLLSLTKDS